MPKSRPRIAVIAGTGVIGHFALGKRIDLETRYGTAIAFEVRDGGFYVLPRHGPEHSVPPHMINYRANIAGLAELGVRDIIATSAVGSMNTEFKVGELGLLQQFLDFTKRREGTFFDESVKHTDVTNPYSESLNGKLLGTARRLGLKLRTGLVYVCAEGPRFESAAEVKMFRDLGGDVVGMTGLPEVVLADEKGIRYASVVAATNWAPGMQKKVSQEEVLEVMKRSGRIARDLIQATIKAETKTGWP
jgi:5'-methylthioadenosine phosphorylase